MCRRYPRRAGASQEGSGKASNRGRQCHSGRGNSCSILPLAALLAATWYSPSHRAGAPLIRGHARRRSSAPGTARPPRTRPSLAAPLLSSPSPTPRVLSRIKPSRETDRGRPDLGRLPCERARARVRTQASGVVPTASLAGSPVASGQRRRSAVATSRRGARTTLSARRRYGRGGVRRLGSSGG